MPRKFWPGRSRAPLGPARLACRLLLGLALLAILVEAGAPTASSSAPAPGISLSLGSDGTLDTGLQVVLSNGSAIRSAMDGYFGPLVDSLPGSNASRAALLSEINASENNPLLAGLFGDRDGHVNALDSSRFVSLLNSESRLIPVSSFTGVLNVSLDGDGPTSDQLQAIGFTDELGADNSSAPLGVTAALGLAFTWSGPGNSHLFQVAWNLPSILGNLSVPVSAVEVSFGTPAAITITSVSGLSNTSISNDPFGYRSASVSGQYTPLPGRTIVVRFGPSFPTGDALIVSAVAVVAGAMVGLLLRRRRRQRRTEDRTPPPGPASDGGTGVGPSSGSG